MGKQTFKHIMITISVLVFTVIVTELLYLYSPMDQNLILLYILAVLIIARITPGYVYGVSAAVIGSLLYDFFITSPRYGFSISEGLPFALIVMLIVSILICTATTRMKDQIALAKKLQIMSDQKHKMEVETEIQKTKSVLLRAISHDLRTPLTGILGQSTYIHDNVQSMDDDKIIEYAGDIRDNSQWLIRMVENLLSVTRISHNTMEVKKTEEVVEEIMAEATSIVRKRFIDCNIIIKAPDAPVTMWMDAILITQVLINILENAVKYSTSGSAVILTMEKIGEDIHFEITDEGDGIPDDLLTDIPLGIPNEKNIDSRKGLGLGLVICKTIIDAHGGKIEAKNREQGGAAFTVILPVK